MKNVRKFLRRTCVAGCVAFGLLIVMAIVSSIQI